MKPWLKWLTMRCMTKNFTFKGALLVFSLREINEFQFGERNWVFDYLVTQLVIPRGSASYNHNFVKEHDMQLLQGYTT